MRLLTIKKIIDLLLALSGYKFSYAIQNPKIFIFSPIISNISLWTETHVDHAGKIPEDIILFNRVPRL